MSLAIVDAREWQNAFDLRTGQKRTDDSQLLQMVRKVLADHPFPGDIDANSNRWVTDTALDLISKYHPQFAFLIYAQQYFTFRFNHPVPPERERLIDEVFAEVERFSREAGFTAIIVGTGDMIAANAYLDLSRLKGLAITSHWLTHYCGLYDLSTADLAYVTSHPEIERIVSKAEFVSAFNGTPTDAARLPDYLAVAREGVCFRSMLLRRPQMIPATNRFIPVSASLGKMSAITDICGGILELLKDQKVALVLVEGVGETGFRLPYTRCNNSLDWYWYEPGEAQYLAISTGKHQLFAYPPGYRSYLEDDESKEYPLSGYFTSLPENTLGCRFEGKSVAVGNHSMFMHTVTGADITVECFARNLYNQGCLGVIHRQDK